MANKDRDRTLPLQFLPQSIFLFVIILPRRHKLGRGKFLFSSTDEQPWAMSSGGWFNIPTICASVLDSPGEWDPLLHALIQKGDRRRSAPR